jgi:hypothetical protein
LTTDLYTYSTPSHRDTREIGLSLVFLLIRQTAGMPENYRFMMDYENKGKKKEIY